LLSSASLLSVWHEMVCIFDPALCGNAHIQPALGLDILLFIGRIVSPALAMYRFRIFPKIHTRFKADGYVGSTWSCCSFRFCV
jgi:hypothetical protein